LRTDEADNGVTLYTAAFEIGREQRIHTTGRQESEIRVQNGADVCAARAGVGETTRACGIEVRFLLKYFGTGLSRFIRNLRVGSNYKNTVHTPGASKREQRLEEQCASKRFTPRPQRRRKPLLGRAKCLDWNNCPDLHGLLGFDRVTQD
jgi:hypothetical protein